MTALATIDPAPVWSALQAGFKYGVEGLLLVLVAFAAVTVFRRIGGV